MKDNSQPANVNITLGGSDEGQTTMLGKFFPCPVCGIRLEIRIARTQKPYCVCIDCGIQIFIRGKTGISQLNKILENEILIFHPGAAKVSPGLRPEE
jgi:hypothetical protein